MAEAGSELAAMGGSTVSVSEEASIADTCSLRDAVNSPSEDGMISAMLFQYPKSSLSVWFSGVGGRREAMAFSVAAMVAR